MEDERRVLSVEDQNVDLLAEFPVAVDDMRPLGLVAPRQVGLEEVEPDALARVALGDGMAERCARDSQAPLDVVVKASKELGQGPLGHATICSQYGVRNAAALQSKLTPSSSGLGEEFPYGSAG